MKRMMISLLLLGGFMALSTMEAGAVVCAAGPYRAGCVAAGGGAVYGGHVYGGVRGRAYVRRGFRR
jgi:hypothetical protein